jgi:Ser/Thr protein kinase RdoA (MazF antagonist)
MRHGYTNHTVRTGPVVTKDYQGPDAARRCTREAAALAALAGTLPVPPLVETAATRVSMGLMAGVPGQDLIDAGLARGVLRACGRMLRRVQATDPGLVLGAERPAGVLVHGDYGPNNVLLDPAACEVSAIVDWEWVHAGDPVEDLAWCEWIVRMHHPGHVGALGDLFDGYGHRPVWASRQRAMLAIGRKQLDLAGRWDPSGVLARQWLERLDITAAWTE